MKKKRLCLFLAVVLLIGLLGGCSKTIAVEADLEDMELDGAEEWKTGEDYEAVLIPDDGYMLPEKITVKVDGSKLSAKNYEFDFEDGDLTIPGEFVTGDIEIIGEAEQVTLMGLWYADIDASSIAYSWMTENMSVRLWEYISFRNLPVRINMVFFTDGTYSVFIDEEDMEELRERFTPQFRDNVISFFKAGLAEEGVEMSLEEAMGSHTVEDLIQEFMEHAVSCDFTDYLNDLWGPGTYTYDGHRIFFDNYEEGISYELEGRELILKNGGSGFLFNDAIFPVVFKYASR